MRIFLGRKKSTLFFGVLYFSSAQINNNYKCNLLLMWNIFGHANKVDIFWVD